MNRLYRYIGPQDIARAVAGHPAGHPIRSVADAGTLYEPNTPTAQQVGAYRGHLVITKEGVLSLADRHTEHVACVGGQVVRGAGEMYFAWGNDGWEVQEVSNQSTGYCPDPAFPSWHLYPGVFVSSVP